MNKKKIAHLSDKSLFEMGDAMTVQNIQLEQAKDNCDEISSGLDYLEKMNKEAEDLTCEVEALLDNILKERDEDDTIKNKFLEEIFQESIADEFNIIDRSAKLQKIPTITTHNNWEAYTQEVNACAEKNSIDLTYDPFITSLSERDYKRLKAEIDIEFAERTTIFNKLDLKFLLVATALQTAKALLFPLVSQGVGYGKSFDKKDRFAHNDKFIKIQERDSKDAFKEKYLRAGASKDEWIEILYRAPVYDTTKGSPAIGFNMEGGYHRLHTLGHDPVLGWIFGTINILTDTVTLDTFATYQGIRNPEIRITPERVPFIALISKTVQKVKENPLNLPAAIAAEKIHLKSDEFTKAGLPIPVLETIVPELAGNLYKNQYDALCFRRDLGIIGGSMGISLFIDMIICLVHGLYYDVEKDGSRDLFEVRTRKLMLISNTIASTSNIICSVLTENPKNLDLGGLLVTLRHLFTDTRFIVSIKKEFIEKKIYEKIKDELVAIEANQDKLFAFEYQNKFLQ